MSSEAPITIDQVKKARFRLRFHARLQGGGLWVYRCVDFPRLSGAIRRDGRVVERTFTVDDHRAADLIEVARMLNGPVLPAAEPVTTEKALGEAADAVRRQLRLPL